MRQLLVILAFLSLSTCLRAQQPASITLEALEQRVAASPDTLFVLNFWATWCRPCIEEMPFFDNAGEAYAAQRVKVIFVSLDLKSELPRLTTFLRKRRFKAEVCWLDEPKIQTKIDAVSPEWTGAIPATLFVHGTSQTRRFHEGDYDQQGLNSELDLLLSSIK
jgi:thiol-disulfide isomerase/thioredoxin